MKNPAVVSEQPYVVETDGQAIVAFGARGLEKHKGS